MQLKNKTIEELLDLEEELLSAKESERDGTYSRLISVYETLFRKISADRESEYTSSLESIKKRLVSYLVRYGTYLKMNDQKDDRAAEGCLKRAVRYERDLPIAYYRLGFLHYKKKMYTAALQYFQNAIHFQRKEDSTNYRMNDQQLYNCHLYLANCGLFIAKVAQEDLERLELHVKLGEVPHYEMSPFFQLLKDNEQYLEEHAYRMITREKDRYCSKEECENVLDLENTIILDFTSRQDLLIFNRREVRLTKNQAEMLRYFLMNSNEDQPVTKHDVYDLFSRANDNGEIPANTYTQNIGRLRAKLVQAGILDPVIENKPGLRETAYCCNHKFPYVIMYRSDDIFVLDK